MSLHSQSSRLYIPARLHTTYYKSLAVTRTVRCLLPRRALFSAGVLFFYLTNNTYIRTCLSQAKTVADIRRLFRRLDDDEDGLIGRKDFKVGCYWPT